MTKPEPKKSVWSDVPRRLTTICIGIPLVWKLLERPTTAYIFFAGAHALSAWEFALLEPATTSTPTPMISRSQRFLFCATSLGLAAIPNDSLWSLGMALSTGCVSLAKSSGSHHWIVGWVFVGLPFRTWCHIAYREPSSFASTISVLLTVWNADTGALVLGRLFGRRNPINRIPLPAWIRAVSPAKTAEGFLGGILGGTLTVVWMVPALIRWFDLDTTLGFSIVWGLDGDSRWQRIGLGVSLSVLAILGDLVESSIKRRSRSKDSGSVLPGHGGILDRFDSSLLAILLYRFLLDRANAQLAVSSI